MESEYSPRFEVVKLSQLKCNIGQIPGVPPNPRRSSTEKIELMKRSLLECPELLAAKGVLTVEHNGSLVILGGNIRLTAAKAIKLKTMPCWIYPESTPPEKLKEIILKDNGHFGDWDADLLNSEYSDCDLELMGVPDLSLGVGEGESGRGESGGESGKQIAIKLVFPDDGERERFLAVAAPGLVQDFGTRLFKGKTEFFPGS